MADYNYTRGTIANGEYDINNPDRVDVDGKQIWLGNEVQTALPGKPFTFSCASSDATFNFPTALSGADETTLTTIVNAHKNNT